MTLRKELNSLTTNLVNSEPYLIKTANEDFTVISATLSLSIVSKHCRIV